MIIQLKLMGHHNLEIQYEQTDLSSYIVNVMCQLFRNSDLQEQ